MKLESTCYANLCQRPERAFFISTCECDACGGTGLYMCQRPERAFFISTGAWTMGGPWKKGVNALNGLFSFLPLQQLKLDAGIPKGVNALNGLFSFLRYPLRTRINTGFAGSFLQVFV